MLLPAQIRWMRGCACPLGDPTVLQWDSTQNALGDTSHFWQCRLAHCSCRSRYVPLMQETWHQGGMCSVASLGSTLCCRHCCGTLGPFHQALQSRSLLLCSHIMYVYSGKLETQDAAQLHYCIESVCIKCFFAFKWFGTVMVLHQTMPNGML